MAKACSFFGHRTIEVTEELKFKLDFLLEFLITTQDVEIFLFGSRSDFDEFCHERVTLLQKKYPNIKRIMHRCRSEYVVKKEEKERLEKSWSEVLKHPVTLKDYDGEIASERVFAAGRASYVERNQEMINASDYCIFYYNEDYLPPRRKNSKRNLNDYQPKSGTKLALDYAMKQSKKRDLRVLNVYSK